MAGHGSGRSRLSYEEWTKRLCGHFFRPENAGAPVTFFVDDELLGRLAGSDDPAEAVDDLVSAVRGRLGPEQGDGLFGRIHRDCTQWGRTNPDSCPPSLPLLAVTVLAATRMARGGAIAAHNYYARLRELLGILSRSGMPRGYDSAVPAMWLQLDWWLEERHRGARGRSTVSEHSFYSNIGYTLSQALFRESDRRQLSTLYRSLRLRPGDLVEPAELLAYFQSWAPRSGLSQGARRMAQDQRYEEQLREILATAFATWDGRERDKAGRQVSPILITLQTWPKPTLGLAAECSHGFPSPAEATVGGSHWTVRLPPAEGGWLQAIPLPVNADLLHGGVRLVVDSFTLELKPAPAVPLRQDHRLGCWTSAAQLAPWEPHWLLVAEGYRREVLDYIGRSARSGWRELKGVPPPGWFLVGEVAIDAPSAGIPSGLEQLAPSPGPRPSLLGGLPLASSGTYLQGGEPDLWVPPATAGTGPVEISVNGEVQRLPAEGGLVELRRLQLPAGAHELRTGPSRLTFSTLHSVGVSAPSGTGILAHRLRRWHGRYEADSPAAVRWDRLMPAPPQIRIEGPCTHARRMLLPEVARLAPLILPPGAREYVLLGARPGQIDCRPQANAPPSWMAEFGLVPQLEVNLLFPVAWVCVLWSSGRADVRPAMPLEPVPSADPGTDPAKVASWCSQFDQDGPAGGTSERALWERYQDLARAVRTA